MDFVFLFVVGLTVNYGKVCFLSEIIFIIKLLPKFLKKRTNKFFESFDSQYFQKKLAQLGK
jgi:hypothetical protein